MNIKDFIYEREQDVASAIKTYVRQHPGQPAEEFLNKVANDAKGFRCIPYDLLTEQAISIGIDHLQPGSVMMWPTWRETYQQTLLDLVSSWEGYSLENAHSGFVDDGIIKIAYTRCSEATEDSSRWSYETGQSELLDRKVESLMNDDIAQFVINSRNSGAIFSKRFASKISGQLFVDAIKKDPSLWRNLYFAERQDVLVEMIKDGFWYKPAIEFTPGDWSKPQTNEEAIERALCCKDTTGARYFLVSYLMAQPIRDLIPLLRPRSRKALMDELYTADQLRPLIREFPHLKGGILEADLGM